ncbi:uncharacterized protein knl1 isoform X2 [Vanacampus margaritifer]
MEPLDFGKNDENSVYSSRRRISSILKASRKSTRFQDPDQQENEVECAKPSEKRNSRRVSFAPANDVLLFSKDVKNVRSPFQELMPTAIPAQNSVLVSVGEDGKQHIMGMDPLISAPLQSSQLKGNVIFEPEDVFGERTVLYSEDEGSMEMTRSHTFNIADDEDYLTAAAQKKETVARSADGKSTNASPGDNANVPRDFRMPCAGRVAGSGVVSSVPSVDPSFDNLLCSRSKSSGSDVKPSLRTSLSRTRSQTADKENQASTLLSSGMRKSTTSSRNAGPCQEDDGGMDVTAVHTVAGLTDDADDPFQCFFPQQEMYSQSDAASQAKHDDPNVLQKPTTMTLGSSEPKAFGNGFEKEKAEEMTQKTDASSLKNPSFHALQWQRDNFNEKSTEKTIKLTADDARMDMTRSYTVQITGELPPPPAPNLLCEGKKGFSVSSMGTKRSESAGRPVSSGVLLHSNFEKFLTNIFKPEGPSVNPGHAGTAPANEQASDGHPILPKDDLSVNMSEFQTGDFRRTDEPLQCGQTTFPQLLPDEQRSSHNSGKENKWRQSWKNQMNSDTQEDCREQTARFTADTSNLDATQSRCANTASASTKQSRQILDILPTGDERTVRFAANDGAMEMTRSLTVNIDAPFRRSDVHARPAGGEKTIRFAANDAAMDMTRSLTVNIEAPFEPRAAKNVHFRPAGGEKTLRFAANDGTLDMTKCFTTLIDAQSGPVARKNVHSLPAGGEETVRFSANDGVMDLTQSVTTNIETPFEPSAAKNVHSIHCGGEKTIRSSTNDAAKDVMRKLASNVAPHLEPGGHQKVNFEAAGGEKTFGLSAKDAAMDATQNPEQHFEPGAAGDEQSVRFAEMEMTRSLTVNIDAPFEPATRQNVDFVPAGGEKRIRFPAMDATRGRTSNIENRLEADARQDVPGESPVNDADVEVTTQKPQNQEKNEFLISGGEKTFGLTANDVKQSHTANIAASFEIPPDKKQEETFGATQQKSLSVLGFNPGQNIFSQTVFLSTPAEASVVAGSVDTNRLTPTKTSDANNKSEGEEDHHEEFSRKQKNMDDVSMKVTEGQAAAGDGHSDERRPCRSSTPHADADVEETTSRQTRHDGAESPDAEFTNKSSRLSQEVNSPRAGNPSRQSKRLSIADIQFKMRRLSHVINATAEIIVADGCTAPPLPYLDPDANASAGNDSVAEFVPDVETGKTDDGVAQSGRRDDPTVRTPFKCKTTELMSRLSTGCFKPKLPERSQADEPKQKPASRTPGHNVTNNLSRWNDDDVSDIHDEELVSCEDLSETLDTENSPRVSESSVPFEGFDMEATLLDDCFEGRSPNASQALKRSLPAHENHPEGKKMKPSTAATEMASHEVQDEGANVSTIPTVSNRTMDSSSSRCEATFNSTFKQSMQESRLEDANVQKLTDGSLTVLEFFQVFDIDFVIHKPRQSVLPGRLPRGAVCSATEVLKNRHMHRPKQRIYEADFEILAGKVEGLNCRMSDLNKPLKMINKQLWEDLKDSSEKEIKSFGVKLKERNNFFRKMSKIRAHEMKEVLYSDLVHNLADQQEKLRSSIESNEMIKMLDDCISDLEAELAAVEEKGTENRPSLKSLQEEMKNVGETLDGNNRQIYELEAQKKKTSTKLSGLKAETKKLQSFLAALEPLNEWRLREKTENDTLYTFLYGTLHLQLVHAGNGAERKTSQINFKFQLDAEKSQGHARLVHKLLSQYVEAETGWLEKYPTSRYFPKLLHDVSLVVSNCRLLGEELQRLEMWGGLRLNILDVCCQDTRVKIAFSSVRRRCKFEVTLSLGLAEQLYVLRVHAFQSIIGDTTAEHIEQIVESFTPAKKLLTKIVKKIHCDRLC